jgi:membrane-associated phospholipid phosphatase
LLKSIRESVERRVGTREPPGVGEFLLMTLACCAMCSTCYFALTERNAGLAERGAWVFSPEVALDGAIPLQLGWIWVYYAYFPALFTIALVTTADRRVMYEGVVAYFSVAAMSLLFFGLLPSRMVQPDLGTCTTIECTLLEVMYRADEGFNIFPSLHVAQPTMITCFFWRYWKPGAIAMALLTAGIMASTVFLRRHYLVDIPAGAALGVMAYVLGRAFGPRLHRGMRRVFAS